MTYGRRPSHGRAVPGSSVVATLEVDNRFRGGQLFQHALQGGADIMRRLSELERRPNTHVHAHDLAFNCNVRMFVREGEFQLRSGQQQAAGFNIATAQAEVGNDAHDRPFQAVAGNFRGEPALAPADTDGGSSASSDSASADTCVCRLPRGFFRHPSRPRDTPPCPRSAIEYLSLQMSFPACLCQVAHLLGFARGRFGCESRGDDHEFVAAHARDIIVLTAGFLQGMRKQPQYAIPFQVSKAVVDLLEAIQVGDHHGQRFVVAFAARHFPVELQE